MKTEKVTEKVPVTKKLKIRVNNLLERMSSLEAQVETWKGEVRKVQDKNRRLETIVLDYAEKYKQVESRCQKLLKAKQMDEPMDALQKFGSSCNTPCRSPAPSESDVPVTAIEPYAGQPSIFNYMMSRFYDRNRALEEQEYEVAPKKRRSNWDILVSCQRDYSNLHDSSASVKKFYDPDGTPVSDAVKTDSIESKVAELPKNQSAIASQAHFDTNIAATCSVLLPSQQNCSAQKSKRKRPKSITQKSPEHPTVSPKQFSTTATDQENRAENSFSKPRSSEEQLKDFTNLKKESVASTKSLEDSLPCTVSTDKEGAVVFSPQVPSALLKQCNRCDQRFSSKKELRSHKKIHHVFNMCQQCSKILSPASSLRDNLCSECRQASETELTETTVDSNSDGAETEPVSSDNFHAESSKAILECPVCQKIYKSEPRMLKHLARHTRC